MCPHLKEVAALLPEDEPYCTACRIFGSAWRESAVVFSDLKLQNGEKESLFRTGVGISRRLGSAQAERLFTTEMTAKGLRFAGEVEGLLTRKEVGWLLTAFKTVTHLGGDKARGLGQVCLSPESLERWDAEEGEWTAEDETKLIEEVLSYATD
jgi:CRISPR/Cas system CSM-associated protein Csm3 (group 7 of RAMP superfamily)